MVTPRMSDLSVKPVHAANGRKGHVSVKRNVPVQREVSPAKFFSSSQFILISVTYLINCQHSG